MMNEKRFVNGNENPINWQFEFNLYAHNNACEIEKKRVKKYKHRKRVHPNNNSLYHVPLYKLKVSVI